MKTRADKILLAVFLLSLLVYVYIVLTYLEIVPIARPWWWLYPLHAWLALGFHAVPMFCLQLLLCRRAPRWCSALLGLAVVGAALWFGYGYFTSTGWDTLGYALLMLLTIAPAAGCALGWGAYGLQKLYKRGDTCG